MLEAICHKCGHSFVPADENDTEHGDCVECGEVCGGQGEIIGEWVR